MTDEWMNDIFDLTHFAPAFLVIATKDEGQGEGTALLELNRAQLYIHNRLEAQLRETSKVRALILKGRQQGCSTYVQARYFHKVITVPGKKAFILAHEGDATDNLFAMTRRFYEELPEGLCPKPTKFNTSEMVFSQFNSQYKVGTAGNKKTGRSQTIHLFHGSEVAFWENTDHLSTGILQTIPGASGSEIILESTANGLGNFFHRQWTAAVQGKSDYQAIFVPWYWQNEYALDIPGFEPNEEEQLLLDTHGADGLTHEHLCWRRKKISDLDKDPDRGKEMFKQEYPFTAAEAFLNPIANTFIKAKWVNRARINKVESNAALIIGVDPADDKDGSDRTAIIRRRGRKAYQLETYNGYNTMEMAAVLIRIIREEKPAKIYIDCIGIGKGIVDRLRELGYDFVEGFAASNSAHDKTQYLNRRAELWDTCLQWLMQDMPVEIPDSDELQTDLCGCGFKYNSIGNGQLVIEDKASLKKRGLPSPDCADALIHTFCGGFYEPQLSTPVNAIIEERAGFFR